MQNFLSELPTLIFSSLLIVMLTVLLVFRVLTPSDALVGTVVQALITFWYLSRAFAFIPPPLRPPAPPPPAPPGEQAPPPGGAA